GAAGFIWVTNGITDVIQIDPDSNQVVTSIPSPGGSIDVVGGFGSVWVTNANANTLSRIDVGTGKVVDVVDVGVSPRLIPVGVKVDVPVLGNAEPLIELQLANEIDATGRGRRDLSDDARRPADEHFLDLGGVCNVYEQDVRFHDVVVREVHVRGRDVGLPA